MRVPEEYVTSADYEERGDAVAETGYPWTYAVRSWLVSGIHPFAIDPRRRTGSHGQLRRLLIEDRSSAIGAGARWQSLVSALKRHTLHGGLAQLTAGQRQLITLAYHEGLTNRQIAAMLGVSVTTVRRRLWVALERLEEYVQRSGAWIASAVLIALSYLSIRAARLGRMTTDAVSSADWSHRLAAAVAAGVVTTAVVGVIVTSPQNSPAQRGASSAATAPHRPAAAISFVRPSTRPPNVVSSRPAVTAAVSAQPDSGSTARTGDRSRHSHRHARSQHEMIRDAA